MVVASARTIARTGVRAERTLARVSARRHPSSFNTAVLPPGEARGPCGTISVDGSRAFVRMSTAMMRTLYAVAVTLGLILGSSPAFACHVDGTVYCDENANGVIDAR